jgi:hypothetical protein
MTGRDGASGSEFTDDPAALAQRIGEYLTAVGIQAAVVPQAAATVHFGQPGASADGVTLPAVEIDGKYLIAVSGHLYVHFQRAGDRWVRRRGPSGRHLRRLLHNVLTGLVWERLKDVQPPDGAAPDGDMDDALA